MLQEADGAGRAGVDGVIEDQEVQTGGEGLALDLVPVIALVDGFRLIQGQGADVQGGIAALADAKLGDPAGVLGVVDQAAFGGEDVGNAVGEGVHEWLRGNGEPSFMI